MSDKTEKGTGGAASSPEIGDLSAPNLLDREPQPRQSLGKQLLAAAVLGSDRPARDQFAGELERGSRFSGRHGELRLDRLGWSNSGEP
jgi:hypothetical protein